jgi:hypothetical protein
MKKRFQTTAKLRKGVAVGSAMVLGSASLGDTAEKPVSLESMGIIADRDLSPAQAIGGPEDTVVATRSVTIKVASEPTWTKADARRFRELATKRAVGDTSKTDEKEFVALQQQRRFHYLSTPDEVVAEWQRRRFISEMLNVLTRNARFFKTENQTRPRAVRQAKRA